jgi:hypothetical protein
MFKLVSLSILLAACIDPEPPTTIAKPIESRIALHDECAINADCDAPALCLSYHGVSGPTGPTISTCEIQCSAKTPCPDGLICASISDGPGSVCQ